MLGSSSGRPGVICRAGSFGSWASSQAVTCSNQMSSKGVKEPGHTSKHVLQLQLPPGPGPAQSETPPAHPRQGFHSGRCFKAAEMCSLPWNQFGSSHTGVRLCSNAHELTCAQASP